MVKADDVPWGDIIKDGNQKPPRKGLLRYVLDDSHYVSVVQSALKALKKKDKTANIEQAASLVDKMRDFARKMLGK